MVRRPPKFASFEVPCCRETPDSPIHFVAPYTSDDHSSEYPLSVRDVDEEEGKKSITTKTHKKAHSIEWVLLAKVYCTAKIFFFLVLCLLSSPPLIPALLQLSDFEMIAQNPFEKFLNFSFLASFYLHPAMAAHRPMFPVQSASAFLRPIGNEFPHRSNL